MNNRSLLSKPKELQLDSYPFELKKAASFEQNETIINYASHMHPLTKLKTPDLLDQDKNSMVDILCQIIYRALPMMLNFFLNYASSYVNIYFVSIHMGIQAFTSICLATVFVNIFLYYLIENIGNGFSIVISYFDEKKQVGYLYQKTLGITFFLCILMTPVIYKSDSILCWIYSIESCNFDSKYENPEEHWTNNLAYNASVYAWALLPSFYLYAFSMTTKNFLQAQGIIFPPIIICLVCFLLHTVICYVFVFELYTEMNFVGAAWAKNISDFLCCLALYFYIIMQEPIKESWVEWDLKSTNNIGRYIKEVVSHQIFTYLEILAFQILCLLACGLNTPEIAVHFIYGLILMLIYFCFVSISQCISKTISLSIEENDIESCRKKVSLGFILTLFFSIIIIISFVQHQHTFYALFFDDVTNIQLMASMKNIFLLVILFDGFHIIFSGIIKTLEGQQNWLTSLIFFYGIGIGSAIIFCYILEMRLIGIWYGWLLAIFLSFMFSLYKLITINWEDTFIQIRQRYMVIKENIRISKMELTEN